ncbi:50S ribosomal protein L10 [Rapidithrix thailandica]|uniref:Large ribosomal subunit protein uL10 n=1 Tax=Rapidithrix thailandica TaxID=413964 RepID=A0AAW9S792_9BACT
MTKEEKKQLVGKLSEKLSNTDYFYITDASGMTVAEINDFRSLCFEKGVEYRVVKNTLIQKALETLETDYTDFNNNVLKGFSGIMFSPEVGNLPAKILKEYRKKSGKKDDPRPLLKGASIDSDLFIGDENLDTLSNLKSKQELIGEIIGLLQSPAKNVVSALQSGGDTLAGLVKTLAEREQ